MLFCRSCFSVMVSLRYVLVFLFLFWATNIKITNAIRFSQSEDIFSRYWWETYAIWHWDTKAKVFHESISWFMKYPWSYFMKCSERKVLQCILPLTKYLVPYIFELTDVYYINLILIRIPSGCFPFKIVYVLHNCD